MTFIDPAYHQKIMDDLIINHVIPTFRNLSAPYRELWLLNAKGEELIWIYNNTFPGKNESYLIGFPRSPEMKPYYPALRAWLKANAIPWRDKQRNKRRYMVFETARCAEEFKNFARDVCEDVFEDKFSTFKTENIFTAMKLNSPYPKWILPIYAAIMFIHFMFLVYELFGLTRISAPTIFNLNIPERAFFIWLAFSPLFYSVAFFHPKLGFAFSRTKKSRFVQLLVHYGALPLLALITAS